MQYQILARKYRPTSFSEVIGQEAIVLMLKNALKFGTVSQAYLFTGTRGTGKTTLARLFAKAINCLNRAEDGEPCGLCSSCLAIHSNSSMDVIEIDGASHRGIDDIRQINDTVGYAASSGGCKIYIIDEVHMLTKEAFNALLKTLEEPPANVKFFLATTEPHKVLATIVSRCQRFDLKRISELAIVQKLQSIAQELSVQIESPALSLIAEMAEGSLRDAESLLDQIFCLQASPITLSTVQSALGMVLQEDFFALDHAVLSGDMPFAFSLTAKIYHEGKDPVYFLESLIKHYRQILMFLLEKDISSQNYLSVSAQTHYQKMMSAYTPEQCFDIFEILSQTFQMMQKTSFRRIHLEMVLMQIIRSIKTIPSNLISRPVEKPVAIEPIFTTPEKDCDALDIPIVEEEKEEVISVESQPLPSINILEKQKLETLLRFASVELNGTIKLHG